MRLFRDEQKIQNDSEVEGMTNNGVDSIPCEGGLVVKQTQVSTSYISGARLLVSPTRFDCIVLCERLCFATQRVKPKQNWFYALLVCMFTRALCMQFYYLVVSMYCFVDRLNLNLIGASPGLERTRCWNVLGGVISMLTGTGVARVVAGVSVRTMDFTRGHHMVLSVRNTY